MPTKAAPKKKATKTTKSAAKSTTKAAAETTTAKTAAKTAAKKAAPKTPAAAKKTAAKAPAKSSSRAAKTSKPAAISEFRNFEPYKTKRGEEYMNDKQREHFKNILKKWKSALMEEVDRTVTHMKDEAANFPDPADRATQEEEFSLELRTRDRERKLIKKIDSTIERIEQDDYGFCDACGVEIGIKRLEARPTASLCIDCKTLAEIKERQELG
jgi:DnaK suppressor protein